MDMQKFEKDMAAFGFGQHQDALTYYHQLEAAGWTIEDAKGWVDSKRKELERSNIRALAATLSCPDCNAPMQLLPVNISPATRTNDESKSVWLCSNKKCMNAIYNKKSVEETLKKMAKKKEKKNGAT